MKTTYEKDPANNRMIVTREFSAPVARTWEAWTTRELLDQWWAPKPWRAETKSMDFREGGKWLYCMVGPEGERHWASMDWKKIVPREYFLALDGFSDEHGNPATEPPGMDWKVTFTPVSAGTRVRVEITFANAQAMQTIVDMGFEEGFAAAHDNLNELLTKESASV